MPDTFVIEISRDISVNRILSADANACARSAVGWALMATDRSDAATSRLTVDDWVQAGFAILAEEGIKALKIDRLCSRLAVTKGSFYWHFTDIAGYRSTLIEAWGELRDDDRRHFGEMAPIPPRERLSQMM